MMMLTVMVLHIISEYLGNPTSGRALQGGMKCSSNKQTAAQSQVLIPSQTQILDEIWRENQNNPEGKDKDVL